MSDRTAGTIRDRYHLGRAFPVLRGPGPWYPQRAMIGEVTHGFEHESLGAKAEWFAGLSVAERLEVLAEYYELAVALNPELRGGRDADPVEGAVLVVGPARR